MESYSYLNQNGLFAVTGVDDAYEFNRLRQSMELVGFSNDSQKKIFSILSAVLLLGNIQYVKVSEKFAIFANYFWMIFIYLEKRLSFR